MELSLEFLKEKLSVSYDVELSDDDPTHLFATARVYTPEQFLSPHVKMLVVFDSDVTNDNILKKCSGVAWVGEADPPKGVPCLWVKTTDSASRVLNRVLDIFSLHNDWKIGVQNQLLERAEIHEVVHTLEQVTSNPFYYCDASFRTLAIKNDAAMVAVSDIYRAQVESGRHPVDAIASMVSSGDLDRINSDRHAWVFRDSATYNIPFVSKTVFCHGGVFGHLFIIELHPEETVCDLAVLEELGETFRRYIEHRYQHFPTAGRHYEQSFKDMLSGRVLDPDELDSLLATLEWDRSGRYRIAAFKPNDEGTSGKEASNIQIRVLEDHLPGYGFTFGSNVVFVAREDNRHPEASIATIERLCGQFGWKAGTSDAFKNLTQMKPYYEQAFVALQLGMKSRDKRNCYPYHRYLLKHLLSSLALQIDDALLTHADVTTLVEYDAETGQDMANTLRAYLQAERNISMTSKLLFMHRNSVNYRIDKIRQMIVTDLDDAESRLALQISLEIWHMNKMRAAEQNRR